MASKSASLVLLASLVLVAAGQQSSEIVETDAGQGEFGGRVARQYHHRRPSALPTSRKPANPLETYYQPKAAVVGEPAVKYDAAGLAFEIAHPDLLEAYQQPNYKKPQSEPAYVEPKHYHTAKPAYHERRPYQPIEPKPVAHYRPEPAAYYPQPKPYQQPPSKYPVDYAAYRCPKVYDLETNCRPVKDCAVWYDLVLDTAGTVCSLDDGTAGACCPDLPYNGRGGAFKQARKDVKLYRDIDIYSLNAAAHAGRFNIRLMDETEKLLRANNLTVRRNSAQYTHLLFFQTNDAARASSRGALTGVETTKELGKRFELTADEAGFGLSVFNLRDTILKDTCPAEPVCDKDTVRSPFRTMDGSCNNLRTTSWGQSQTQFQRALVPQYADGVWQPRVATNGKSLPSARLVSISVVPDIDAPHDTNTLWVMQYGQFVDHDLTSTPVFRMNANGTGITCCTDDGQFIEDGELLHPECLPIEIPKDDPFFAKFGQRCMSFVRSTPAPRFGCSFGHGEQMNQLTHFLDHSNVYGSNKDDAVALRTLKGGLLKVTPRKGHHELPLLPPDNDAEMDCSLSKAVSGVEPPAEVKCFKAGDSRVDEQPNLAVTHTIFMRQHNTLATELAYINPYWDDERLYQEARRILIAQMQHITYNEWLPIVIGRDKMQELGLLPLAYGFSDDYDDNLNPTIVNEFAAAAFRFGHSLIQGHAHLVNQKRKKEAVMVLRQHFFKSQIVYTPGNLDKFLIGLATQPIQDFDNYFTEEITNHLFEEEGKGFGMDLVALNIQRSRDHGIPGYNAYRALCGLPPARYFNDLLDVIPPSIVERFELLYSSVDDIDLFIGGTSERPVPGALVGPTFQCIIADQFLRLKRGDRFFYDLGGQAGSFSEAQLYEIRQSSFARIICDNSNVYTAQPLAFKTDSPTNPIVECNSPAIPRPNLLAWKEEYHHEPYHQRRPNPPYRGPHYKL